MVWALCTWQMSMCGSCADLTRGRTHSEPCHMHGRDRSGTARQMSALAQSTSPIRCGGQVVLTAFLELWHEP